MNQGEYGATAESGYGEPPEEHDSLEAKRRAFHGSRDAVRPGPSSVGDVVRLSVEPRNDCVLLGPPGSGKTALVSSFRRAGELADSREFQALPVGALADLAGEAERYRFGAGDWPATQAATSYSLQTRMGSEDFLMKVQDGPGGLFFPFSDERWDALAPDQKYDFQATCLVLCIDAVNPQPGLWQASLLPLLACLLTSAKHDPLIRRVSRETDFPRLRTPKQQLPFERVLVALTRIDPLIEEAVRIFGAVSGNPRYRLPRNLSPEDLALRIDPIRLLHDRVGPTLGLLRSALRADAKLAVGLTSAWGFRSSEPLRWSPFGVREALIFLAKGECHGPVACVEPESTVDSEPTNWTELEPAKDENPGDIQ